MKKPLLLLSAVILFAVVHEGAHALVAALYGEYQAFHVRPYGLEVTFVTPAEARSGARWAAISGAPNLLAILIGYLLLWVIAPRAAGGPYWSRALSYLATVFFLLLDPFNLAIGPLLYGGDAIGIAVGLGVSRYAIQAVALAVLLLNRELVAQRLLPLYGVETKNPLFRPWLKLGL